MWNCRLKIELQPTDHHQHHNTALMGLNYYCQKTASLLIPQLSSHWCELYAVTSLKTFYLCHCKLEIELQPTDHHQHHSTAPMGLNYYCWENFYATGLSDSIDCCFTEFPAPFHTLYNYHVLLHTRSADIPKYIFGNQKILLK